jgi:hypothetical protein
MTIANDSHSEQLSRRQQLQTLQLDIDNTTLQHSPTELERLRHNNPHLQFELTADGKLAITAIATTQAPATNGRYPFPELTPEEIERRVAAFDRFRERKRQLWESLTPEEKAEHDRQFADLYKLLEESRK